MNRKIGERPDGQAEKPTDRQTDRQADTPTGG